MIRGKRSLVTRLLSFTLCLLLIFTLGFTKFNLLVKAAATDIPAKATLSHNQWGGDFDGDFDLTWNLWYGNNGTRWKVYEKIGAGQYKEIHEATIADNTPNPQSGSLQIRGRTIEGTYKYYVTLSNAYGTTTSNEVSIVVGSATGNIAIGGVDTEKVVTQFTQNQGLNEYELSFVGAENPKFTVKTNNRAIIGCSVQGNILKVNGLQAGRGSLKITETVTGETRYVGVRIRNADGSLPGMPDYVSVGSVSEDKQGDLDFWRDFDDDHRNKRMDIRYIYINGGPINGWRSWTTEDGARAKTFITESRKLGMIPFFVYYNIPDSGESYDIDLNHIQSQSYMEAYYQDLKFFLDICKQYAEDDTVGIVFEPDFLGYMMQQSGKQPNEISAQVKAAYTSGVLTQGTDPDFPDTVEGLVKSVNYIVRKYYPEAYFGWQFNLWAYDGHDVPGNGILHTTETLGLEQGLQLIRSKARLITDYYTAAGVNSYNANFVSIDKYGLDGGALPGAAADPANSTWFWNADIWNNYLEFVNEMKQGSNLPVILWQIPVGHINGSQASNPYTGGLFPDLNGTDTKYEDSAPSYFLGDIFKPGSTVRFDYFKTNVHNDAKITDNGTDTVTWEPHMDKVKEAGVISILFGAGVNSSTDGVGSPPTDDYWWITKVQQYLENPVDLGGTIPVEEPPVAGIVAVDNPVNNGEYTISVEIPSQSKAKTIKLYENDMIIHAQNVTSSTIIVESFTNKSLGTYTYKAEYINEYGSAFSQSVEVTVQEQDTNQPPVPEDLTVDSITNTGDYTVTIHVPAGNTATSIKLYENDINILEQSVESPGDITQSFQNKEVGTYTYRAEYMNAYGSTLTPIVEVVVKDKNVPQWLTYTNYVAGDLVYFEGKIYKCLTNHQSLPGWEPSNVPALWQLQ